MQQELRYTTLPAKEKVNQIAEWLQEKKGQDLLVLDLSKEQALAEITCIVTATSTRHAQGLADYVLEKCKENKFERLRSEGQAVGQWVLLDLNDIIVHIMQPESRSLFKLDALWPTAPILIDQREQADS